MVFEKRSDITTTTPMMKQYLEVRGEYEGHILFYRLGDFYECFFEDAIAASRELELTLTGRDCGEGNRAAMCGVPFHKADLYIGRLVEKGYKVAICEQTEDPKAATGLVKREVVRVITPGTVTDGTLLTDSKNNFLLSLAYGRGGVGIGFADVTTGEVFSTFIKGEATLTELESEIAPYAPREAIINILSSECPEITEFLRERFNTYINDGKKTLFDYDKTRFVAREQFGDEFDSLTEPEMIMATGALITYIKETQKCDLAYIKGVSVYSKDEFLEIDINSRRNLELTETMRSKDRRGSLLWVLDRTETAMGARMLHSWLNKPLVNPVTISHRQSAVSDMYNNGDLRSSLALLLDGILDIERLTSKAAYGTANAKDLQALGKSIERLPQIKALISQFNSDTIKKIYNELDVLSDVSSLLSNAICENPPLTVREGGMIRDGFNADVDYYRSIKNGGKDIMASIEEKEREATGIRTLKVGSNSVFGYYIEVSKSFVNEVPERYIRKQTLTSCERYITQELKEMESTIFTADEKLASLEFQLLLGLRGVISENSDRIRRAASLIAELDVYLSLSEVASKNNYVCPEVDTSTDIIIKDGRHPVVEKFVKDSYFVPNDTLLDTKDNRMMIITGPNMAGKSTYMRQVAIIAIMAQIGSFVPAREAKIGIVDKLFTRVGASDDLASGQSTFMLEMNEVAFILKNATRRSLIIYDEVGRGTSTFDGMAIARAVVEYTHSNKIGAKTLFATHYHELTDMEDSFEGIVNYNIVAKKRADTIIFLRKIVRGGTDDSYGIEVAKLAGVPNDVIKRAKEILKDIESGSVITERRPKRREESTEIDLFTSIALSKDSEAIDKIKAVDINTLTPIEAMNLLYEIKKMISD